MTLTLLVDGITGHPMEEPGAVGEEGSVEALSLSFISRIVFATVVRGPPISESPEEFI